ncbi:hypothetical protein L7F22_062279 [Adiantum nelumboides]|nr:hypothetical protein [Adiantum nelumboides]
MHEDRMSKEFRDHEERMFKLRMEEDTKRMDMFMRVQVEMAKALGNRQKDERGSSIVHVIVVWDSTIRKYTQLIVGVLCGQDMLSRYQIVVPSGTRLAQIITDFEAITGLCNMCGAIDGTHIKLACKPVVDLFPAQYVSRHGFHSILLQGIVDSKKLFWNVVCNAPGGSHDSNVFKSSQVYRDMKSCEILSEPLIELNRLSIRPYLVGDSAYKPTSFLLKAFKSKARQDLALKNAFDKQIAKDRVKVENAFGILKNRWRILRDLNGSIPFAPNVVIACCVLHNYVQLKGEPKPYDAIDPHPNDGEPLRWRTVTRQRAAGLKMRVALFSDFVSRNS